MKLGRTKLLKSGGILFGLAVFLFGFVASVGVPMLHVSGPATVYAAGCPGGNIPNPGPAAIGVCLTQGGNQLTTQSGFTVTVTHSLTGSHTTSWDGADGLWVTNGNLAPIGTACGVGNAGDYVVQITATNSAGGKFTTTYNSCANSPAAAQGFITPVALAVTTTGTGPQVGAVKGCITYTAPDGTTQPFDGSSNASSPATATITGPSGPNSKTINVGIDAHGCLTGATLNNLPVGTYTITANYAPGLTPHGVVPNQLFQKTFTITAGKVTDITGKASTGTPTPPAGPTAPPQTPTCENSGFSLAWILCPIIEGLAKAVDGIYHDMIAPLLVVKPIDVSGNNTTDQEKIFQIWLKFRLYGDLLMFAILLFLVYGQATGGGQNAYTAKKMLPRMVVGFIFLNMSIYVFGLAVDLTNILAAGIQNLLESPFQQTPGGWSFNLGGTGGQFGSGITIAALVGGGIWAAVSIAPLLYFLFTFILLPGILIFIAILVTILVRQALIVFLVFAAPIAAALYCLPAGEPYARRYVKLTVITLGVYPYVALIFALDNIFSVVVLNLGNQFIKPIAPLVVLFSQIALVAAVPFAFSAMGGVVGRFHEFTTGWGKKGHQAMLGNPNDPNSMRNRARFGLGDRNTLNRERIVNSKNWGSQSGSRLDQRARRRIGRLFNYGHLDAKRAVYNKAESERQAATTGYGNDRSSRDQFIAYDEATDAWYRRMDMKKEGGRLVPMAGASSVYDGYALGKTSKDKAMRLAGKRNKSGFQDSLYYEWKKSSFNPVAMENIGAQYDDILKEHGFSTAEGSEAMKAVGFRHQGQSLATKYSKYQRNGQTGQWGWTYDTVGMTKEMGLNLGVGELSRQDPQTIYQFEKGYSDMAKIMQGQGGRGMDEEVAIAPGHELYDQYHGKTYAQVKDAKERIRDMSGSLSGSGGVLSGGAVGTPAMGAAAAAAAAAAGGGDHGGGGTPGMPYGAAGASYAPVDVQRAVASLADTVGRVDQAVATPGAAIPAANPRLDRNSRV